MSGNIRYLFFDTETTGLDYEKDKIINIAFVEMLNEELTGNNLEFFFNPEMKISEDSQKIHNISNEMLLDKPLFHEKIEEIVNFIDNPNYRNILVAHNASFDLNFLKKQTNNHELFDSVEVLDTLKIARKLYSGQKVNLNALCEYAGVSLSKRDEVGHNALLDSLLLADVFKFFLSGEKRDVVLNFNNKKKYIIHKQAQVFSRNMQSNLSEEEMQFHELFLKKFVISNF